MGVVQFGRKKKIEIKPGNSGILCIIYVGKRRLSKPVRLLLQKLYFGRSSS